jgi:hypothetical protein
MAQLSAKQAASVKSVVNASKSSQQVKQPTKNSTPTPVVENKPKTTVTNTTKSTPTAPTNSAPATSNSAVNPGLTIGASQSSPSASSSPYTPSEALSTYVNAAPRSGMNTSEKTITQFAGNAYNQFNPLTSTGNKNTDRTAQKGRANEIKNWNKLLIGAAKTGRVVDGTEYQSLLDAGVPKDYLYAAGSYHYGNNIRAMNKGIMFDSPQLGELGINSTWGYTPRGSDPAKETWNLDADKSYGHTTIYNRTAAQQPTDGAGNAIDVPAIAQTNTDQYGSILDGLQSQINGMNGAFNDLLASAPTKPEYQSSSGAGLSGNATGFRSAKSSWKKAGKTSKGTNNLKIQSTRNMSGVGLNIAG